MKRYLRITLITSFLLMGILGIIVLIKNTFDERAFATNNPPVIDLNEDNNEDNNKDNNTDNIENNETPDNDINDPDLHIDDNRRIIYEIVGDEVYNFSDNEVTTVKNPSSIYVLVNKKNELDPNYVPDDLVIPNVRFSFEGNDPKKQMRAVAASALEKLLDEADKNGHDIVAVSGYRSYTRQETIYKSNVNRMGEESANKVSAKPGQSEHQTGLAMDVSSKTAGYSLTDSFADLPEGIWLGNNAHKFGYIIRYQKDKTDITGYVYEPWHIRYVGEELATYLYENDLTLEEFYEEQLL